MSLHYSTLRSTCKTQTTGLTDMSGALIIQWQLLRLFYNPKSKVNFFVWGFFACLF